MPHRIQTPNDYWPQVYIALAQVTFALAWGSLFLPLDTPNIITIFANFLISAILILVGDFLRKKK